MTVLDFNMSTNAIYDIVQSVELKGWVWTLDKCNDNTLQRLFKNSQEATHHSHWTKKTNEPDIKKYRNSIMKNKNAKSVEKISNQLSTN